MDTGCKNSRICPRSSEPSSLVGSLEGVNRKEEEDSLRESLLTSPPAAAGEETASPKKKRYSRRKVQWKDSHGKKLVEVLEFEPSDSSDSEDYDDSDYCICTIM